MAQSGPDLEGSAVAAALCERVQLPEERDVQRAVLVERVPIVHEYSVRRGRSHWSCSTAEYRHRTRYSGLPSSARRAYVSTAASAGRAEPREWHGSVTHSTAGGAPPQWTTAQRRSGHSLHEGGREVAWRVSPAAYSSRQWSIGRIAAAGTAVLGVSGACGLKRAFHPSCTRRCSTAHATEQLQLQRATRGHGGNSTRCTVAHGTGPQAADWPPE
jgi:hypothetical protein